MNANRRLPVGAEITNDGVHFRVWAPRCRRVEVVLESNDVKGRRNPLPSTVLQGEGNGYFSGLSIGARAGALYRYRLDEGPQIYPDPASRFQPSGPHGPSQVIDPTSFLWTDSHWPGVELPGQVLYELHVGTFTREGTFDAVCRELQELAAAGITVLEIMPVADFPGSFGWGYDGVNLFAPSRLYGSPDDLRRLVDRAHAAGLGVILDVVYNHVGPDGNYLNAFSDRYFTDRYKNEWGEAINFDDEHAGPVREFFIGNAGYWIDEFHLDGLRLDATQQIFDCSREHVLSAIHRRVRQMARDRKTLVVAENETQETQLVRPVERGGFGLDALWNDDFHHSAFVALTGHNEAYYTDYRASAQELLSAVKWGYLYQGQRYKWQRKRRGTPALDVLPSQFVIFLENHDQIANSGRGERRRLQTSPGRYRALTALLLLAPGTPMLFQGQEFGSSSPFLFFADHNPELARLVRQGRHQFLSQFPSLATGEGQTLLADPCSRATFERCKLNWGERERNAAIYSMHKDLLKLRRHDAAFKARPKPRFDGAILGPKAFLVRFFVEDASDRLMLVNLGADLHLDPAPEPLLAPPAGKRWEILWSSEDPSYGGKGTPAPDTDDNWHIPGEATVVLAPVPVDQVGNAVP